MWIAVLDDVMVATGETRADVVRNAILAASPQLQELAVEQGLGHPSTWSAAELGIVWAGMIAAGLEMGKEWKMIEVVAL